MEVLEKVVGSDTVLFWLDEHICIENNCKDLKEEFERTTGSSIYLYHNIEQCRNFLASIANKKLFCIIQGKYAKDIVPDIVKYTISPVVYIFCMQKSFLDDWAKQQDCTKAGGLFDHEKDILTKLTIDLASYADSKAQNSRIKRAACEEWAKDLTDQVKRLKHDQNTLMHRQDPYSDQETTSEQAT